MIHFPVCYHDYRALHLGNSRINLIDSVGSLWGGISRDDFAADDSVSFFYKESRDDESLVNARNKCFSLVDYSD